MKKLKNIGIGMVIGIINSFFGAGGGMIAVPLLKSEGFSQKDAHRNAVAVILPITVLSAFNYLSKGYMKINDAFPFVITGLIGAFIGVKILEKLSPKLLKGIFGGFMIYAGVRLLVK